MRIKIVVLLALLSLAACTGQTVIPQVNVQTPVGIKPTPGQYAVMIQSGGWALKTKADGWTCSAWTFDTDVNGPYETAMRDVLTRSLEKVTFVAETMTPEQLKAKGMTAQVIVYQGNADSKFSISQNFFSGTARSDLELTVTLAILDDKGLSYQQTTTGKGSGSKEIFTCNSIGEAVGVAAQDAIQDIVKDIVLYVRDGLRDRLVPASPATAGGISPTPQS